MEKECKKATRQHKRDKLEQQLRDTQNLFGSRNLSTLGRLYGVLSYLGKYSGAICDFFPYINTHKYSEKILNFALKEIQNIEKQIIKKLEDMDKTESEV